MSSAIEPTITSYQLLKEINYFHISNPSQFASFTNHELTFKGKGFCTNLLIKINGIIDQLQYLCDYIQFAAQDDIEEDLDVDIKQEFQTLSSRDQDCNNLSSEITQCRKQKLIKQHQLTNRPKKPVSSFVFYFRQQLRNKDHPSNERQVGKLAKIISCEWKQMSDSHKEPYNKQAQESKKKYKQQMQNFNIEHADEIEEIKKLKRMTNNKMRMLKRKKQQKSNIKQKIINHPDQKTSKIQIEKPKPPLSSFFIFCKEKGEQIGLENGENKRAVLAKLASEEWHKLASGQKEIYEKLSKINKQRYQKQMENYKYLCKLHNIDLRQQQENQLRKKSKKKKKSKKSKNKNSCKQSRQQDQNCRPSEKIVKQQYKLKQKEPFQRSENILPDQNMKENDKEQAQKGPNKELNTQLCLKDSENLQSMDQQFMIKKEGDSLGQASEESEQNQICQEQFSSSSSYIENIISQNQQSTSAPTDCTNKPESKQANDCKIQADCKKQAVKQLLHEQVPKIQQKEVVKKKKSKYTKRQRDKDSHKPKGPISSFFLFYNCIVRGLTKEFPTMKGSELVKIASERWGLMKQQERQMYQQQAKKARQIYEKQMETFKIEYPEEASQIKKTRRKRRQKEQKKNDS